MLADAVRLTCQCITVDIREHHIVADQQLRLEGKHSVTAELHEIDLTHIEGVKDPVEILPPTRNHIFVPLRVEGSRDRTSFTLVDDLPLDLGHSPAIETLVSEPLSGRAAGSTYVVSCWIAPSPDWLRSSSRLPFKLRSRELHTRAQNSPRSTRS